MRKALITSLLIAACLSLQAQSFFIGPAGGVRLTYVHNTYMADYPYENRNFFLSGPYDYSFGYQYSLAFGLNFADVAHIQLSFGNSMLAQRYDHRYQEGYLSRVKVKALDFPVLFRYGELMFFEIGPWLSYLYDASYDWDFSGADFPEQEAYEQFANLEPVIAGESGEADVTAYYTRFNAGLVLGGGAQLHMGWYATLITGFRFGMGMLDARGLDNLGRSIKAMNEKTGLGYSSTYFMFEYHVGLLFHFH